jgi:hypothetical protein
MLVRKSAVHLLLVRWVALTRVYAYSLCWLLHHWEGVSCFCTTGLQRPFQGSQVFGV